MPSRFPKGRDTARPQKGRSDRSVYDIAAPGLAEIDHSGLSVVGILVEEILAVIGRAVDLPDSDKELVVLKANNILTVAKETADRADAADRKISLLSGKLRTATEALKLAQQERFGASSEKGFRQLEDADFDFPIEDDIDTRSKPTGKRARKLPVDVKVEFIDHYPADMTCCSCGDHLKTIKREERVGTFKVIPEHVVLVKDVYHTCACNKAFCKENAPQAAKSKKFIMKGRTMSLDFVMEAAAQKFFEHSTVYRTERRMKYGNFNLSRQAISANILHVGQYLRPVSDALMEHAKAGHVAHMDETPVRIQAPGKGKCSNGYFWAVCRDERKWDGDAKPAVGFQYATSRAGAVAQDILADATTRYLQTDGYAGYNLIFKNADSPSPMRPVRCWAHARRKFDDAEVAQGSPLARKIKSMIARCYTVEEAAIGLPPDEREHMRRTRTLPVLLELRALLDQYKDVATGKLKGAITYTLNAFEDLQRFVFDGRLEIDNNPIERCIRGIALTKKNSLFAGNEESAGIWAVYYSLIESARLNKIDPRKYLSWVTREIERTRGEVDYTELMPWNCPDGHVVS